MQEKSAPIHKPIVGTSFGLQQAHHAPKPRNIHESD
jgi:hypothetical protein